jgi:chemotaxis protein MotB
VEKNNPVIIKKIKKCHGGHHGGAWKLAYADFVTAMMAFFLLMWLLGTTEPAYRQGIAEYFQDPWKPSIQGGPNTGDATSIIQGGGEDITREEGQVKMTNEGTKDIVTESQEGETLDQEQRKLPKEEPKEKDKEKDKDMDAESAAVKLEQAEKVQLAGLQEKLEQMLDQDALLNQFKDQLRIDITTEGLRIQIIDEANRPMFSLAKAKLEDYAASIIDQIAPVINELPNRISITGHTDARPYPGNAMRYSNWELSADRANAARKELIRGGLREEKILRIIGLGSSVPLVPEDPNAPTNRRIAIIVMNKRTEEGVLKSSGLNISEKQLPATSEALRGNAPAPPPRGPKQNSVH